MSQEVGSLWPDAIDVNVLSPFAILQLQADALREKTAGILKGQVRKILSRDARKIVFDVEAPALERYRHRLLSVTHGKETVYPAKVDSYILIDEELLEEVYSLISTEEGQEGRSLIAATQEDFVRILSIVFRSKPALSVIQSLIAQSNEGALPPEAPESDEDSP